MKKQNKKLVKNILYQNTKGLKGNFKKKFIFNYFDVEEMLINLVEDIEKGEKNE